MAGQRAALIPRVCAAAGVEPSAIAGVGVAGCVPCVLLLDDRDRPLRPALLYNDARAHAEIDDLSRELARSAGARTHRCGRHAAIGRAQAALAAAPRTATCGRAPDESRGRTTGSAAALRMRGSASATGRSRAASTTSPPATTRPISAPLPGSVVTCSAPIRDPADVIGGVSAAIAARTGLRAGIPVVAGLADHVSSAFGAGLARHGDLLVKLGGSVDVLACSDRPLLDARLYLDAHPSPGLWLPNGCMASGGSGVRWFQRELAAGETAGCPRRGGRGDTAGADGIVMLPYLLGEKTPLNDPLARGALVGLQLGHTRGHLFRAVLESFAYGVRHHLEVLAEHGLAPGAGARHQRRRLLGALEADRRGCHRPRARARHRPPWLGARRGVCRGMGSGAFTDWSDVARFVALAEPIAPRAAVAGVYDERYRAYRALYEAVKPAA